MATTPTPTRHPLPQRLAGFPTLTAALDYAARGETGLNFYDSRARFKEALPYAELRTSARALAGRLLAAGCSRGDRVAVVADTDPDFATVFFACQYAGLVPVPLPISLNLGGRAAYREQLQGLLAASRPRLAVAPERLLPHLVEAAGDDPGLCVRTPGELEAMPPGPGALETGRPADVAYLQFTSGSTRFPRGVTVTHAAVMENLRGSTRHGLRIRPGDRTVSWLPFYHDMGLVGFLLGPMVTQLSADYLSPRAFSLRPTGWLKILSQRRGTIAFGPPIGYELCARRLNTETSGELDLSSWRVAGVGAEMIRPERLAGFADLLEPSGFDAKAFLPCYGLAESTLAVTFSRCGAGVAWDEIDPDALDGRGRAEPAPGSSTTSSRIVDCGTPLPGHEIRIADESGLPSEARTVGRILVRGDSVMDGYFQDPEATEECLDPEGWLDTGDLGYLADGHLFVTGRRKDLVIVNGRNLWPQDLEALAERDPELRRGDAAAFGVEGDHGGDRCVVVVQCRGNDPAERQALAGRVRARLYRHFGVRCILDLVPRGTLPKTSSGKLSRSRARKDYLARQDGSGVTSAMGSWREGAEPTSFNDVVDP